MPAANSCSQCRIVPFRSGDGRIHISLAEILLSFRLGLSRLDSGAGKSLVGPSSFSAKAPIWRLAANRLSLSWRAYLRFFLGDVELLFQPKMDLPYSGGSILVHLRNATARLRRLHSLRAGIVRPEKLSLAQLARLTHMTLQRVRNT